MGLIVYEGNSSQLTVPRELLLQILTKNNFETKILALTFVKNLSLTCKVIFEFVNEVMVHYNNTRQLNFKHCFSDITSESEKRKQRVISFLKSVPNQLEIIDLARCIEFNDSVVNVIVDIQKNTKKLFSMPGIFLKQ